MSICNEVHVIRFMYDINIVNDNFGSLLASFLQILAQKQSYSCERLYSLQQVVANPHWLVSARGSLYERPPGYTKKEIVRSLCHCQLAVFGSKSGLRELKWKNGYHQQFNLGGVVKRQCGSRYGHKPNLGRPYRFYYGFTQCRVALYCSV